MRQPLVAGNWKMNGDVSLVKQVSQSLAGADLGLVDVLICPPFPYLGECKQAGLKVGAQNLSQFDAGAHTGEVAGRMLKELGCDYVIVGHSERRTDNGESNQLVALKTQAALDAGLTPLVCVGESLDVRENGDLFGFIADQLDAVIAQTGTDAFARLVVAYEPIWAIGTGKTASPEQAQEVHQFVREHLGKKNAQVAVQTRILYGGSVKADNAQALFAQADIDGGLVGGASLHPEDFLRICQAAKR